MDNDSNQHKGGPQSHTPSTSSSSTNNTDNSKSTSFNNNTDSLLFSPVTSLPPLASARVSSNNSLAPNPDATQRVPSIGSIISNGSEFNVHSAENVTSITVGDGSPIPVRREQNPFHNYHVEMSIQSEDAKYYAQKLTGATSPSMQPSNPSPQQQSQQPPAQQKQPVPKPDLPASPSVTVSPIKSKPMGASNSSRSLNNIAVGGSPLSRFQTPTSQPHLNGNMNYENIPLPNTVSPHENIDVLNKVSSVQHLDYPSMSIAERMANLTGTAVIDETLAQWGNQIKDDELSEELQNIFLTLQKCLEIRTRNMAISLQRPGDNPKDSATWNIYPPPPPPSYPPSHPKFPVSRDWQPEEFCPEKVQLPGTAPEVYKLGSDGVYRIYDSQESEESKYVVSNIKEYFQDMDFILNVISDGPTKSFAFRRLRYLESKFHMYVLLNEYQELADSKRVPHRDFYNVRKVDTHVHHSSCMNQKHLLRFIKSKLKKNPDDLVIFRDNKNLTLAQVFESLNLTAYDLSIDTLDMHAHKDSFHRFDKFNLKYNPIGESRLREIFLKTDNMIEGKYLADLTKEVMSDLEASKYQMAEYRISIYGRSKDEWDKLANWVVNHKIFSNNVRWLIQIPRLYNVYKTKNAVNSFEDIIRNIYEPLFEVTKDPSTHPNLHIFLERVIGFDSVDDESKAERRIYKKYPYPHDWNINLNPPYSYYLYYMFANMVSLNAWRKERGLNTFVLRPHAGEAGDTDHLTSAFLTSHSISHGILLRKVPALQYLYYLDQIGIAMSPLSNNALFLNYERNPFYAFFQRGLNVSLSTDDPLQFHFTKEPLIEEYSVAAQIWKLSGTDMCEIARHSVLQSGWESQIKKHWLGDNYQLPGPAGNDIQKTNIPNIRLAYRWQTLLEERIMVLGSVRRSEPEFEDDSLSSSWRERMESSVMTDQQAGASATQASENGDAMNHTLSRQLRDLSLTKAACEDGEEDDFGSGSLESLDTMPKDAPLRTVHHLNLVPPPITPSSSLASVSFSTSKPSNGPIAPMHVLNDTTDVTVNGEGDANRRSSTTDPVCSTDGQAALPPHQSQHPPSGAFSRGRTASFTTRSLSGSSTSPGRPMNPPIALPGSTAAAAGALTILPNSVAQPCVPTTTSTSSALHASSSGNPAASSSGTAPPTTMSQQAGTGSAPMSPSLYWSNPAMITSAAAAAAVVAAQGSIDNTTYLNPLQGIPIVLPGACLVAEKRQRARSNTVDGNLVNSFSGSGNSSGNSGNGNANSNNGTGASGEGAKE